MAKSNSYKIVNQDQERTELFRTSIDTIVKDLEGGK